MKGQNVTESTPAIALVSIFSIAFQNAGNGKNNEKIYREPEGGEYPAFLFEWCEEEKGSLVPLSLSLTPSDFPDRNFPSSFPVEFGTR